MGHAMRPRLPEKPRVALGIRSKFLLVFVLIVPALFAVPVAALRGLSQIRDEATHISSGSVRESQLTQEAAGGINDGYALALRIIPNRDGARRRTLDAELATEVIP